MFYLGHRRFLPEDQKFRCSRKAFIGETEIRPPPELQSRSDLVSQMEGLDVILGKHPDTIRKNKSRLGDKAMP